MNGGSPWERRIDRKGFVAASALAALAAASGGRLSRDAFAAVGREAGGTLHYYNWVDYVNPKTYDLFRKATGIRVKKSFYPNNEALLAKLKAGARGFDLVVPTGYMVTILAQAKLLEPIDWRKLPNVKKTIDSKFVNLPYDPKNQWSVPKDWGTTGFVYRTDLIKERPTSWSAFFALFKKYPRKFMILDESQGVIGSVAVMMGYSYNTEDRGELETVRKFLLDLKPYVHSIDAVTYREKVVAGKAYGGIAWNGDAVWIAAKKPAQYVVAREGGEFWVDTYAIPVDAKNPDAAHRWIDFVYQPKIAALETSYTYYAVALKRGLVSRLLAKSVLTNPAVFPPPNLTKKLVAADISPKGTRLRERIWTEFKSA